MRLIQRLMRARPAPCATNCTRLPSPEAFSRRTAQPTSGMSSDLIEVTSSVSTKNRPITLCSVFATRCTVSPQAVASAIIGWICAGMNGRVVTGMM